MTAVIAFLVIIFNQITAKQVATSSDLEIPTLPSQLVQYVRNDNMKRYKVVEDKLNDLLKKYEVDKYQTISGITHGIASGVLDLANARQDLRENLVYASIMPQFKPPGIKPGKQQQLWDAIDTGVIQIYSAVLSVMSTDAEFQGNFYRLHTAIQSAINNMNNGLEYNLAINVVKKELVEWLQMQKSFEQSINALSDETFNTLKSIIGNTRGAMVLQEQLQNRQQNFYDYTDEFEKYQLLEDDRLEALQPIRTELAEAKIQFEVAQFEFKNAKNSKDIRNARERKIVESMDQLWDTYSKTDENIKVTKYRTETYTTGWWFWKRKHTKTVPYTETAANPERNRIKQRIDIWTANKNENNKNLKSVEEKQSKWKNDAEQAKNDIIVIEQKLKQMEKIWNAKLEKQAKLVDRLHKKWYDSYEQIQKSFEETGVLEENIVEFLKMAHQFPERAMKTHQANKGMNELIKSFHRFLEQGIGDDDPNQSIKDYFTKLGAKNNFERIYTAMSNEGMNTISDLEIRDMNECAEILKVIDDQLDSHNESKLNFIEKRKLKWEIEGKFKIKQAQSKTFKTQFPLIVDFFKDMHQGVRVLKNELPFFSSTETTEYIGIAMDAKKEL